LIVSRCLGHLFPKQWKEQLERKSGARASREHREISGGGTSIEDVVCCALRLGGGMDEKFAIVAKFLE
jgi:hypothetical protein